jgi:hypothetical protein
MTAPGAGAFRHSLDPLIGRSASGAIVTVGRAQWTRMALALRGLAR